jgi:hypothetical protein
LRQDLTGDPADGLGAALVNGIVIPVTNIAAMEAYSAPVGYVFSLNAGGRSGVFDVIAGDFSTELAADTLNGVYIGLADDPTALVKVAKRRLYGFITPEMFGAVGDGVTDYSKELTQSAIFAASETGELNIGSGTFMIDPNYQGKLPSGASGDNGGILIPSNLTIRMSQGTVLKAIPTDTGNYSVLRIWDADNVYVFGGTVTGDLVDHIGTVGEQGHCIDIRGSSNVSLYGVSANQGWGEGFYIGETDANGKCLNVYQIKCHAYDNNRNGAAVVGCDNFQAEGGLYETNLGTLPYSGIDFEPNGTEENTNCSVIGATFRGNVRGVDIVRSKDTRIIGCIFDGNVQQLILNKNSFNTVVEGNVFKNSIDGAGSQSADIRLVSYASNISFSVNNNTFHDFSGETIKGSGMSSGNKSFTNNTFIFNSATNTNTLGCTGGGFQNFTGNTVIFNSTVASTFTAFILDSAGYDFSSNTFINESAFDVTVDVNSGIVGAFGPRNIYNGGFVVSSAVNGEATRNTDPASVGDLSSIGIGIIVNGSEVGDYVEATAGLDLQGLIHSAYVEVADTVRIRIGNLTGGAIDLPATDFNVKVTKTDY